MYKTPKYPYVLHIYFDGPESCLMNINETNAELFRSKDNIIMQNELL